MKNLHIIILYVALLAAAASARAEEFAPLLADSVPPEQPQLVRPVSSAYWFEAGSAQLADTYLTPLVYHGYHLGLAYSRMQAMRFSPHRWTMALDVSLQFDRTENPAHNASMSYAHVSASWGMLRRWQLPRRFTLAVGGSTGLNLGAFYNDRNSNNPVAAKAAWTVNLTALAAWRTHAWSMPLTLAYRPTVPLIGAFFSPEYDELYYEISLGNHRNLAHVALPWKYFSMDNFITADFRFGSTGVRLGLRSEVLSTKVNGIVTRCFTNSVVVGVVSDWIGLSPQLRLSPSVDVIRAIY